MSGVRCLIRHITRRSRSGVTYEDATHDTSLLTIGRAADQSVRLTDLRVALQHAQVTLGAREPLLSARALSGVWVNSHPVQTARLAVGDVLTVGNHRLDVIEPPPGYQFALQVELPSAGAAGGQPRAMAAPMTLSETRLAKRPWSWALLLATLAVFLVLPAAGTFDERLREALRELPVGSDRAWSTGELANPHRFIGDECMTCHQTPFVRVRDPACTACHADTPHHVDPATFDMSSRRRTTCASCHHEHNVPSSLVRRAEALCTDCHRALSVLHPGTRLADAGDFSTAHPEFRVTLTDWTDGRVTPRRVSLSEPSGLHERPGIEFSHARHLAPDGIKTRDGRVRMTCGDCHRPEPGGAGMQPIDMETTCRGCHRLTFEASDPEREVPHGGTKEVEAALREYYAARALEGGFDEPTAPAVVRERRRPGHRMSPRERLDARAWAEAKAAEVAQRLFGFTTCATCHEVTRDAGSAPGWHIAPVHIAHRWMPKATFSHREHRTRECTECHRIAQSELSSDVNLPGIQSCRECHGGERARGKLASACVDCHGFHIARSAAMSAGPPAGREP